MIIYKGPSQLDLKPIVAIATGYDGKSKNIKTAEIVQTWIMRSDVEPHLAVKTGQDSSVCGDCPHRHINPDGSCYVLPFQAPLAAHRKFQRGGHKLATEADYSLLRSLKVRAGSYGDPAAVPLWVWAKIGVFTGYSRQWRSHIDQAHFLMASVINVTEKNEANKLGFRTFRVSKPGAPIECDEIICPSVSGITCEECGLCAGSQIGGKNIVIPIHGNRAKRGLHVVQ